MHRSILRLCGIVLLHAAACATAWSAAALAAQAADPATATAPAPNRPHVIFLLADDHRPDGAAALGNRALKTPHLDRLVARGMTCRNTYCFGSFVGAVCMPSRNMLLSGQVYFRYGKEASPARPNFPAAMKAAGYRTYHHGKKGNTAPKLQALFDVNKYVEDGKDRTNGEPGRQIVDEAIAFLKDRPAEQPVFMYLAFSNPHDPRVAAPQYRALYDPAQISLPKNFLPQHPFDNGEMTVRDEKLAPWPRTPEVVRQHLHDYYATISGLDHHIGRLLAALTELGLDEQTIVIFSSDHGLAVGSHGLFGKQSLYEHSMRAPLVFAGPGIPQGKTNALMYLHDIFPTVCDLVGAPVPEAIDGISQVAVLKGKTERVREVIFTAYCDVQRSVRRGDWKLIRYPQIHKTQLFDLAHDPDELINLADEPAHAERVAELMKLLAAEQAAVGDTLPLSSVDPKPAAWTPPAGQ